MYPHKITSTSKIIRKYLLVIVLGLISFRIDAKVKSETRTDQSYSAEIIDSLFFEQIDSFLNSRLTDMSRYKSFRIEFLVYIDPEKRKKEGKYAMEHNLYFPHDLDVEIDYIPNKNDSVMYICITEQSTYVFPNDYYKLRFKEIDYWVTKQAVGIFIKRKKKIYIKRPNIIKPTLRDLMGHFWYLQWKDNHISPIVIKEQFEIW